LKAVRYGITTKYIYDLQGNLLADTDVNNNILHYYIYGAGLLEMVDSTGAYCYHFDATGNTVAMTNSSQNIANAYTNDPFGNILDQQETDPQPFKYVGQYGVMAEANGFCYMRARYYDPQVGRFVSEDPKGFDGGVNLYEYASGNPVNRIDPFGLCATQPSHNSDDNSQYNIAAQAYDPYKGSHLTPANEPPPEISPVQNFDSFNNLPGKAMQSSANLSTGMKILDVIFKAFRFINSLKVYPLILPDPSIIHQINGDGPT